MAALPIVDVAPLVDGRDPEAVAAAIDAAARRSGFFYVVGHGIPPSLVDDLDREARAFFSLPDDEKAAIAMDRGGRAWRGWFPVGGELTSGVPDRKEGIYFGAEVPPDDRPLHGPNLFPQRPAGLRPAVLAYLDALTDLGHLLVRGFGIALGRGADWFDEHLTADPLVLFRIFHYPPGGDVEGWGVGEHTDYGLLTILRQDTVGGLEVRTGDGWVAAPPVPDSFVCNLGDMLERMTDGRYRSTPHRVRNTSSEGRLSYPFFFDPGWDVKVRPDDDGTYGDYVLSKVSKVFPDLGADVL